MAKNTSSADFSCEFSNEAHKYIQKLDVLAKERILDKIEKLERDPFPSDMVRVQGMGKTFRVRVGDQWILYVVRFNPAKIIIVRIDKRSRVYD